MSVVQELASFSIKHVALNPIFTGPLLWVLTKGSPELRNALLDRVASLNDPRNLARTVSVLKALLAVGLLGTVGSVNQRLNSLALNNWRTGNEKKRWNLNKEIAVITGGSSGIGELVVKGLVQKGVTVVVLDVQDMSTSLQNNPRVHFYKCDITDPATVYKTADRIRSEVGNPSILINNAGLAKTGSIFDTSDEWLKKIYGVNVFSNYTTVKAFLPDMIAKNKGHVVTVASTASFISLGGFADYTGTKAALLAFHEGLNQELRHRYNAPNVLTTSIHPNWVRTPLLEPFMGVLEKQNTKFIHPQQIADAIVQQIEKASSAQIIIPNGAKVFSLLRGFPNWIQEYLRTPASKMLLGDGK